MIPLESQHIYKMDESGPCRSILLVSSISIYLFHTLDITGEGILGGLLHWDAALLQQGGSLAGRHAVASGHQQLLGSRQLLRTQRGCLGRQFFMVNSWLFGGEFMVNWRIHGECDDE